MNNGKERIFLGAILTKLRLKKGISIRELADRCDIAPSTIVRITQGKFSPRYEIVERIVKELGGTIEIK